MKKQSLLKKVGNVVQAWASAFLLVVGINLLIGYIFAQPFHPIQKDIISFSRFLYACVVAPFAEELIFRHLPLQIASRYKNFDQIKWYLVGVLAVIFGWLHGSYFNVLVQGVVGFFMGWVYIKNKMSYLSAVGAHFLWNLMLGIVFPLLTQPCAPTQFFKFW